MLLNVGDWHLAHDLAAEAYTRAWMSWRNVRDLEVPRAWVVRTALNAHVSWWRRRRREVSLGDHDAGGVRRAGDHQMNDNDTLAAVRDSLATAKGSFAGVHMNTSADAITREGPARHRRHKLTSLTGATAAAAGIALAITALAVHGHPSSQSGFPARHPGTARLAAWTVAKQANGDITVTVRQLSDPSGLQSTLRADGVPASVTSVASPDPSCRPYPMTQALFTRVYPSQKATGAGTTVLTINPSALPSGAGVQLEAAFGRQAQDRGLHRAAVRQTINHTVHQPVHQTAARADNGVLRVGLVSVSQQCTGS